MVFSSLEFLFFFLPAALGIYYALPKKLKNAWLFLSGLLFYSFGEPKNVLLLLLCCAINYAAGLLISRYDRDIRRKRAVLVVSLILDLGILGIFKYTGFAVGLINAVTGLALPKNIFAGIANSLFGTSFSLAEIALPIGISFFTFQSMSYTVDLYLGNIEVQKSFVDFSAYVTCFPQIVAGPIVRYRDVSEKLKSRRVSLDGLYTGICRFVRGLAKKVLLANNIGLLWRDVKASDLSTLSVFGAWLGIIAFAFQIYFDFSGYSDMAIGLGKMLGFDFPENFDLPYTSKSVREFWQRWHISLGQWFRSYVYIPLGGSRCGTLKTVRNLAIVWLLTGLWHGARLNFLLWGAWFGLLIIAERLFLGRLLEKIPPFFGWLYTFLAVLFGWVLFEAPSADFAISYFGAMFGRSGVFADPFSLRLFCENSVTAAICLFLASGAPGAYRSRIDGRLRLAGLKFSVFELTEPAVMLSLLLASAAYLVGEGYNPFLYFNF